VPGDDGGTDATSFHFFSHILNLFTEYLMTYNDSTRRGHDDRAGDVSGKQDGRDGAR
jgi:hypothetical protein